jgi:glycosyltransferase involved in cell wall biosynthesis
VPAALWHFGYRLFHRRFRFELVPNRQLKLLTAQRWRAAGGDPSFTLKPIGGVFPAGWVVVKALLQRGELSQKLKLYYDVGWGMSETTAVTLPVSPSGVVDELVKLPRGIRSMRWDPMDAPGEFSQGPVVMVRVWLLARMMFAWKAVKYDPNRPKGVRSFLRRLFLRHERLYKEVHQLKSRLAAGTYKMWIRSHRLRAADRRAIARHIDHFATKPLISVLMPVFNARADVLAEAIESVRSQLYPHWELCIADDASTAPHVREVLEKFRHADSRIKVDYRQSNGHISAASNSALAMAAGEFIALLDHDDMLSEQALYQVVAELNNYPKTDIIYTDEDKIYSEGDKSAEGRRDDPHFKSGWNPDLLYSQNYISHLGVYRAELVKSVGGFREGFEGSQDFDLLLRCIAARGEARVRHIPVILYHWRAASGSTALSPEEKSYATEHGIKALEEHFRARGIPGVTVKPARFPTTYHVRFPLPEPPPKVSLIIPTKNHHEILRVCVDSIVGKTTYPNYEIVVIDNQSDNPESLRYFEQIEKSGVRILRYDQPFNYSAINNFAVDRVDGEVVGLLNNDIEVISPDWLTEMVSHAIRPDIGAVGAKLYFGNDTIQHAGVIVGLGGVAGHSHKHLPRDNPGYFRRLCVTQNLSAVTGACLVVRKDSYLKVGGLESEQLTVAFNDVDFCLKLCEIGLRNVWTPHAELYHHESASRGPEDSPEKIVRFQQEIGYMKERWGSRLRHDPYYSPILTLDWENFTPDYRIKPRKPWLDELRGREEDR